MYRESLTRSVRQHAGFRVAAEAADGEAVLEGIRSLRPEVAVIDLPMDGLDAKSALRAAADDGARSRIIALVADTNDELVFELIAGGAAACLSRSVEPAALVRAIEAAARGDTIVSPQLQGGLAREVQLRNRLRGPLLTPREREILGMVADGLSTAEIGGRLHLAPTTVKTHLGHAFEKLGATDRASAVAAAMRRGLLR